jgi:hypothetical protein
MTAFDTGECHFGIDTPIHFPKNNKKSPPKVKAG